MTTWDLALRKRLHPGPGHESARFDLDVRLRSDASRVVLFGPSGAGKSQTLRLVAGIGRPDAGRVEVAGRVLSDSQSGLWLSPQQRRLAHVYQDYALFPHLSVRQNISFARRCGGLRGLFNPSRQARDAVAERWLRDFHLEAVADHLPHQISGGQRQRTALARALVNEPCALLLDEPFAALDRALRRQLRRELKALQQDLRLPMLLITHDDEDVAELAEQVVHLQHGRVVEAPLPADGPELEPLR
ncbi:sulfate/molybdate ABC transporter ATP-binding protein [Leptothrix sp. BB-4]